MSETLANRLGRLHREYKIALFEDHHLATLRRIEINEACWANLDKIVKALRELEAGRKALQGGEND